MVKVQKITSPGPPNPHSELPFSNTPLHWFKRQHSSQLVIRGDYDFREFATHSELSCNWGVIIQDFMH